MPTNLYICCLLYVWIDAVISHNEDQIKEDQIKDSGPLMQIGINLSKLVWFRDNLSDEQSKFITE